MKRKKPILSYPGLRYAHKKLSFACKKTLGQIFKFTWKNFCAVDGNCMVSFLSKKFKIIFLSPVCSTVLKKPQKWFNFFKNVWNLYDKHFLHTLDVWNCMIMIVVVWNCMISFFGVWRSTRVISNIEKTLSMTEILKNSFKNGIPYKKFQHCLWSDVV